VPGFLKENKTYYVIPIFFNPIQLTSKPTPKAESQLHLFCVHSTQKLKQKSRPCIIIVNRKEDKLMPTLKHLFEELQKLAVDPGEIRVPGKLYDDLVEQAEDTIGNPEEE
jgi:hypothetical protein